MQAHCGASGIFFAALWFFLAHHYKFINLLSFKEFEFYLLLIILSLFVLPIYPIGGIARGQFEDNKIKRSRNLLRLCSVLCVTAFTLLLWFTGGPSSPFVSLFVMTYTLTLSKVKTPSGPIVVLLVFLISFLISSISAKINPVFSDEIFKQISYSNLNYYSLFIGGAFSFIIPFGSILLVKHKAYKESLKKK